MNKILEKRLMKMALPMLPGLMDSLVAWIIDFKKDIPLLPGETHVAGVIHEEQGQIFIVVCAFNDFTVTRKINIIKASEIQNLLENGLPDSQ